MTSNNLTKIDKIYYVLKNNLMIFSIASQLGKGNSFSKSNMGITEWEMVCLDSLSRKHILLQQLELLSANCLPFSDLLEAGKVQRSASPKVTAFLG